MRKAFSLVFSCVLLFSIGCAGRNANLNSDQKIPESYNSIIVFPFSDPHYKGQEITGVGTSFAVAFVNEVLSTGKQCVLAIGSSIPPSNIKAICEYAIENGAEAAITGVVTEWLDGATQWSGKVDVAAVTIYAYDAQSGKIIPSASAREKGMVVTFVNSPTTRFYRTLSKELVATLF